MTNCNTCGAPVGDDAVFCGNCGAKIERNNGTLPNQNTDELAEDAPQEGKTEESTTTLPQEQTAQSEQQSEAETDSQADAEPTAMPQAEWTAYFEMVNGRAPSEDDLEEARQNGEVAEETAMGTPDPDQSVETRPTQSSTSSTQMPGTMQPPANGNLYPAYAAPTTASNGAAPAKKKHTLRAVIITLIVTAVVIVVGLYCYDAYVQQQEEQEHSAAMTACETSQTHVRDSLSKLNSDIDAINEDTDKTGSDYKTRATFFTAVNVTQDMLNDYQNAEAIANKQFGGCNTKMSTDTLTSNTTVNKQLKEVSDKARNTLVNDFPDAFQ